MYKKLTYDDVKHISGTNPYLLSFLEKANNVDTYASRVNTEIHKYLEGNLNILQEPKSLSEHIVRNNIGKCIKFAHCASNGAALNIRLLQHMVVYKSSNGSARSC